jgi:hypothetical protein
MTSGVDLDPAGLTDAAVLVDEQPRCPACDHDLSDHDVIAARYCRASESSILTRRCICPTGRAGLTSS